MLEHDGDQLAHFVGDRLVSKVVGRLCERFG